MEIKEFLENQNAQYAQIIGLINRMMIENMSVINSIKEQEAKQQEQEQVDYPAE